MQKKKGKTRGTLIGPRLQTGAVLIEKGHYKGLTRCKKTKTKRSIKNGHYTQKKTN